jgi:hypothetical protein
MAQVNPKVEEQRVTSDPNYLGYSDKPDKSLGNKSTGVALEGLSEALGIGAKGFDTANMLNAQKEVYDGSRAILQDFIPQDEQTAQALGLKGQKALSNEGEGGIFPTTGSKVPAALEKAGSQAQRLQQAFEAGKLGKTYYDLQLETLAKSIKNRYRGYEPEIDQMFSSITGEIPANALRASSLSALQESAKAQNASVNKHQKFVLDNFGAIQDKYPTIEAALAAPPMDVYNTYGIYEKQKIDASRLAMGEKMRGVMKGLEADRATSLSGGIGQDYLDAFFKQVTGGTGKSIDQLLAQYQDKPLPPEVAGVIEQALNRFEAAGIARLEKLGNEMAPGSNDPADTWRAKVGGPEEWKKHVDAVRAPFARMREIISTGATANVKIAEREAALAGDHAFQVARARLPWLDIAAGMGKGLGANHPLLQAFATQGSYKDGQGKTRTIAGDVTDLMSYYNARGMSTLNPATGRPYTDINESNRVLESIGANPKDHVKQIDAGVSVITSPQTSPQEVKAQVLAFFTPNGLASYGDVQSRAMAFERFTQPAVTEAIHSKAPEHRDLYRKWSVDNFSRVFSEGFKEIQDSLPLSPGAKVTFNSATGQIDYKPPGDPSKSRFMAGGSTRDPIQDSVSNINKGLLNLAPILKKEGLNVGEQLELTLDKIGLKFNSDAPQTAGQSWERLAKGISQGLLTLKEKVLDPEPKKK